MSVAGCYFDRCLIFRLLRFRRRCLFFLHFSLILESRLAAGDLRKGWMDRWTRGQCSVTQNLQRIETYFDRGTLFN